MILNSYERVDRVVVERSNLLHPSAERVFSRSAENLIMVVFFQFSKKGPFQISFFLSKPFDNGIKWDRVRVLRREAPDDGNKVSLKLRCAQVSFNVIEQVFIRCNR